MYIPHTYGKICTPLIISASNISLISCRNDNAGIRRDLSFAIIFREWNMILNAATWQYNSGANGGCACFLLSYLP